MAHRARGYLIKCEAMPPACMCNRWSILPFRKGDDEHQETERAPHNDYKEPPAAESVAGHDSHDSTYEGYDEIFDNNMDGHVNRASFYEEPVTLYPHMYEAMQRGEHPYDQLQK